MIVANPGSFSLATSLLFSLYAFMNLYTSVTKREIEATGRVKVYILLSFVSLTLSLLTLTYYFLTDNFSVEYVFSHSTADMPLIYKISAMFIQIEQEDLLTACSLSILTAVQSFFLAVNLVLLNPFETVENIPPHGLGLNPLLETHEMLFHPPVLFAGYATSTFLFALSIAGLYLLDERWILRLRKWALTTWMFLTAGIALGAFWAYRVLGWGGFWGWDPVENASLLPWLTVTALIHSIMIQEARRGMKIWNILLSVATFEFVLLGTLITRSGVISSVHAFAQSEISFPLTVFMIGILVLTADLLHSRRKEIESLDVIESPLSKEASFLLNNLLFTAFALSVFWGTIFPMLSEGFLGYKATIGEKYYLQTTSPLAFSLVALIGLCVGLQWRKSSIKTLRTIVLVFLISLTTALPVAYLLNLSFLTAFSISLAVFSITLQVFQYFRDTIAFKKELGGTNFIKIILKKRRRYGGYTAHLGAIIVFIGVVCNWTYAEEHVLNLKTDEPFEFYGHTLVYRGYSFENTSAKASAKIQVDFIETGKQVFSKIEYYYLQDQVVRRVGILHELLRDIYIIPEKIGDEEGVFRVKINPLTDFIWIGSITMLLGGMLSLTPRTLVIKMVSDKGDGG